MRHATRFVVAVENFRFYDLQVHAFTEAEAAVAEVKAKGPIKPTGGIYLPGLRAVPASGRRQDLVPARIFRSYACSQSDRHSDSSSLIVAKLLLPQTSI